ncbi:hypothetical protein CALCODRAFT_465647 [Calocera cornea HHB12733]|uniref:Protein N-terminal glutamine amidohydrolase n=1 Tax=Calocera cornea HHB12733 TaxID=1353952 RepID=A0A165IEX3_9BASI|nr:hypothetical protein CALCODRAFT_465647 [Calocera cornea HHB12733]
MSAPAPPVFPAELIYTPNYCEENVYYLTHVFNSHPEVHNAWDIYAIFISNDNRCVALWQQKSAQPSEDGLVLWDYHCILALVPRAHPSAVAGGPHEAWIYDGNSLLGVPVPWSTYMTTTFRDAAHRLTHYRCKFRAVNARQFLDWFASDRSHMIIWDDALKCDRFISAPPRHPVIVGPAAQQAGITNNLMQCYVSMGSGDTGDERYGVVIDYETFAGMRW